MDLLRIRPGGVMKLMDTLAMGRQPTPEFLYHEVLDTDAPVIVKVRENLTIDIELVIDGESNVLSYTFPGPLEIRPAPLNPLGVDPPKTGRRGPLQRIKAALKEFLR